MITYYVAASLDGFIATPDGGLAWLQAAGKGGEDGDFGYTRFLANIDVLVMGRKTYDACLTLPSWPYGGHETWVLTRHNGMMPRHNERFAIFNAAQWRIESDNQRIYLVGGGETARLFLETSLVDKLILTTHPVLLGRGLPLFGGGHAQTDLILQSSESFPNGLIQATYFRK